MERLVHELATLSRCEDRFKIPAARTATQLAIDNQRPIIEPPTPQWKPAFQWPADGRTLDFTDYWKQIDSQKGDQ